jgi:undecaprenyl-diphosphatase
MSGLAHSLRGFIETRDHALMRAVHRWRAPRWVRLWMVAATRSGDGWLWCWIGLVLAVYGGPNGLLTVARCGLAAGAGVAIFIWLKRTARRRRPCALEPHCWSTLLPPDQFSFPSGHTITAFAVSVPVIQHYPSTAPEMMFLSISIAASRIVLGMHFLSDVAAGAVIGCLLGYLSAALL